MVFKNAKKIDRSLRNSIERLSQRELEAKMQEFESFLASLMLACMPTSKEATATLNANTQRTLEVRLKS
ncbi:hypothetical protein Taitung16_13810 [Helicobacter pylori]